MKFTFWLLATSSVGMQLVTQGKAEAATCSCHHTQKHMAAGNSCWFFAFSTPHISTYRQLFLLSCFSYYWQLRKAAKEGQKHHNICWDLVCFTFIKWVGQHDLFKVLVVTYTTFIKSSDIFTVTYRNQNDIFFYFYVTCIYNVFPTSVENILQHFLFHFFW